MSRSIIITGASSGIGRACAERFIALGWNVALIARRAAALAEVAGHAPNALAVACDVTDADAVAQAFDETAERFGRLDVLFNNAGLMPGAALIDEVSPEDWRAAVEVNLTGMFLCARAAFGRMRRQEPMGGRIINNGSVSAHAARPGSVAYTSTKHAITGLTKALELDGRAFDITCGQIDIGNARTELAERIAHGVPQADGSIRPEPMIEVAHVVDAVVHMAALPAHVNMPFVTVMAAKMPFLARG